MTSNKERMKRLSIYIHIPFCVRKCLYCDFLSFPVSEDGNYVNHLLREIEYAAPNFANFRVVSVFIGGGTPTLLPEGQIAALLAAVKAFYQIEPEAEITIEMNPGTATWEKLQEYRRAGVNRLSIGLQSADDEELARIGRIHDYAAFLDTWNMAGKAGFRNVNIDLMSALPGQNMASWKNTLQRVVMLSPEHISAYSLILEEGTPLYDRRPQYHFPTEEEDREMYLFTGNYLAQCGYRRYEISNYAKEGYECRHNKVYWQRGNYVGFGLGASSMTNNVRWRNPHEFVRYNAYVEALAESRDKSHNGALSAYTSPYKLSVSEQMEEFMFLGLRLTCGVNANAFKACFGRDIAEIYGLVLDRFYRQQLLEREGEFIRLTPKGIDISNYVMAEFLL